MRSFLEEGGFGAFTNTFEDLGGLRQLPGLAVQRLMADGYGFGAEGDWKTAILVRVAAVMGHGLPGGASDRKSTRLNSSHVAISYAVFCLKKKINILRRHRYLYSIVHVDSRL